MQREYQPWWHVDLGSVCAISQVRVFNRIGDPLIESRANRLSIDLSDDDTTWRTVFRKDDGTPLALDRFAPFLWTTQPPEHAR